MAITYQERWEMRSSIRSRPRKAIDFEAEGWFFPPEQQALFSLPEVKALSKLKQKEISILSFYKYLDDIVNLELNYIHHACRLIMSEPLVIEYADEIKLNANLIIIDEYYHVYIANDYIAQLKKEYPHLPSLKNTYSDSMVAMTLTKEQLPAEYRAMFEIIAVCIFETSIIKELVNYFNSPDIHPTIKYYLNDHMNDESRHYSYFFELMKDSWSRLPEDYKNKIGFCLGGFIKNYLNIEGARLYDIEVLSWLINDTNKATSLVNQLYEGFEIHSQIPIVRNVLEVLEKVGMMTHPKVIEGMKLFHLI